MGIFNRLELLIGEQGLQKLARSRVIVFGLGGVGGFAAECLVRSGVGSIAVVDGDVVDETNFNRQLLATWPTVGKFKVDVACERFLEINSQLKIQKFKFFYGGETAGLINLNEFDYVVDAIDDLNAKELLVFNAFEQNVPVVSAMGAGNKFNAAGFEEADLFETSVCPVAKIMRRRLKSLGISRLRVIYSKEKPKKLVGNSSGVVGSTAFVPPVVGCMLAGVVVRQLLEGAF